MKFLASQLSYFFADRTAKRNVKTLLKFLAVLLFMMATYSVVFHFIAAYEGQQHSWLSGFYWVVVTMTTLGYGDIVFHSDLGRVFSSLVILSGVLFLLVVLPFSFIQLFYAPWLEAQTKVRAPRSLPEGVRDHVIITRYEPVTMSLIPKLIAYGRPYCLLVGDLQRALDFHDQGLKVVLGAADDLESYQRVGIERAAMVVASGDDFFNSNVSFTVREVNESVPIVSIARAPESLDILELSGSNQVLLLAEMLGRSLARRAPGGEQTGAIEVGRIGEVVIAEAPVGKTPLLGKTLRDSRLREVTGVNVVGLWRRGAFESAQPHSKVTAETVLLLAGTDEQLDSFSQLIGFYTATDAPVVILGGGRVGRAAATCLSERGIDYRLVEQDASRIREDPRYVLGSAADLAVLERAGIREAPAVLVTTHDDAINIYLTIYCRKLRPDIQIVSRATLERNVSTLHRAGADFVMSYASMGANAIFNALERADVVMLAEGLDVFRVPIPERLAGRTLLESGVRERTGCSVVAVESGGVSQVNPDPAEPLPSAGELILIGSPEAEHDFLERYRVGRLAAAR
jgi:voltage-gated potassium channel